MSAAIEGQDLALALFNRRSVPWGACLWLGESGDPTLDRITIEHNGVLTAAPELAAACLDAARFGRIGRQRPWFGRRLVLSGLDHTTPAAASGRAFRLRRSVAAPFIDLAALRHGGGYLAALSANTRQQLRRSDRAYTVRGPLLARRAETVAEAHEFLDALAALHQVYWTGRGRPGAFADPFFRRFHRALIATGLPRGEIDLLRVTAGGEVVGYLYNFRHRGQALAYQSGFDYAAAGRHAKPGLTCHHAAIRQALAMGLDRYDFLAGEARYKRSLSTHAVSLHWAEIGAPWAPRRLAAAVKRRLSAAAGLEVGTTWHATS